jgi:hypothetical protein
MTKEELEKKEEQAFAKYKVMLLAAENEAAAAAGGVGEAVPGLSYFENNLETWRQLWHVLDLAGDLNHLPTTAEHSQQAQRCSKLGQGISSKFKGACSSACCRCHAVKVTLKPESRAYQCVELALLWGNPPLSTGRRHLHGGGRPVPLSPFFTRAASPRGHHDGAAVGADPEQV